MVLVFILTNAHCIVHDARHRRQKKSIKCDLNWNRCQGASERPFSGKYANHSGNDIKISYTPSHVFVWKSITKIC